MTLRGAIFAVLLATALVLAPVRVEALVEPMDADTSVACYTDLNCVNSDRPISQTIRDCCLNNAQGRAYSAFGSELCVPCVVYGWTPLDNNRFTEQGPAYNFEVSYTKRGTTTMTGGDLTFTVTGVDGAAVQGANRDYSVNTGSVSFSLSTAGTAAVIFRVDSLGLEVPENFTLRLGDANPSPTSDGVFFINTLELVIEDGDGVILQLTEDDYLANERDLSIGVDVTKNFRIATDLVLTISPITLTEARALSLVPQGVEVPDDNMGRSPVEADLNDFNNTIQTIIFMADEFELEPRSEESLQIPINDDAINEAPEQDFVAVLNVSETVNIDRITITRASSLCRINDNDPIRIGFEMEIFTFSETMFDETYEIFLAKENNVVSEQTFLVSLQINDFAPPNTDFAIAEFGVDYGDISRSFTTSFSPNFQRIPVSFAVFADLIPEQTEAFQINSASDGTPDFNIPNALFAQSYVIIEDDDVAVRIGFENTTYTVDEGIGSLEVCVRVLVPDDSVELPLTGGTALIAVVTTVAGTADENDYTRRAGFDIALFFDNAGRRECFDIDITDDELVEGVEMFSLTLENDPFTTPPIDVEYFPNVTVITINDMDEAVIGFIETNYTADESDGFVTLAFGLISGGVQEPVEVALTLSSGSAQDGSDFDGAGGTFTFDPSRTVYSYNVSLEDDDIYEFTENFFAQLSFVGTPTEPERVSINPDMARVEVEDDDVPEVNVMMPNISVPEPMGEVPICIVLSTGITEQVVVTAVTGPKSGAANQATADSDYSTTTLMLTFEPSGESQTVCGNVSIINDLLGNEPNELFSVTITEVSGDTVSIGAGDESCVEIIDDDTPDVKWEETVVSIPEGGNRQVCFTSDIGTSQPYQVRVGVRGKGASPATQDDDYTLLNSLEFSFTMESGERFCVDVNTMDDTLAEGREQFELFFDVIDPAGSATRGEPQVVCVNIEDNDVVEIGFIQRIYDVSERAVGPLSITVQLVSGQLGREVIVTVNTMNGSAIGGVEFISVSNHQLTFSPNVSSHVVLIEIIDNHIYEDEMKNFTVCLSTHDASVHLVNASTIVNIIDDDTITIGFLSTIYAVNESQGTVNIEVGVLKDQDLAREVVISFTTSDSTAIGGDDYIGFNDLLLTFDSSNMIDTIHIAIINDESTERLETFSAHLSFPGQPIQGVILAPNTTVAEIYDDDEVVIEFSSPEYLVNEGDEQVNIEVRVITGSLQKEVGFNLYIADLTAHAGEDFIQPDNIPFTLNSSQSIEINVPINNDDVFELRESFSLHLSSSASAGVSLNQSSAKVTIFDDDELIFGFGQNEYTVSEDDGLVQVDIIFSRGLSGEYQPLLFLSTNNGTAKEGKDFEGKTSQITFTGSNRVSSQTISIYTSSSTEGPEKFSVSLHMVTLLSLNNGSSLYLSEQEKSRLILDPRETNITIVDNDVTLIGFLNSTLNAVEGDDLIFTVGVLQGSLDVFVTVMFTTEDATAKAGSDYDDTSVYLAFIGESVQMVSVKIIFDEKSESPEKFYGKISAADSLPSNVRLEPFRTEVIITDKEGQQTKKPGASVSSVVIAVATCAVFVTLVTVVLVIVIIILKKKYDSKREEQTSVNEHYYESVIPPSIPLTSVSSIRSDKEVGKSVEESKEEDVMYDQIESDKNDDYERTSFKPSDDIASVHGQAITLSKNDAYECTSFKPSDEPATDEL